MAKEKKQKRQKKPHLIFHSILLVLSVILVAAAVLINSLTASLGSILDVFAGGNKVHVDKALVAQTDEYANQLAQQVELESAVLLQNNGSTLPLSADVKQINVFGWASTAWLGGGSGSGGVSRVDTDFLAALKAYSISYNTELTDMYKDFQNGREYTSTLNSWPEQSCRLYEPDISDTSYYTAELLANAKSYSNTAIVVLGRISGESNDATQEQYKRLTKGGDIVVDDSRTYLDLSTEEEALLAYVGENYENVVVVLNTANVMALGAIETTPGVDTCLMAGFTGQNGASALPLLLWGEVSPSGKTADTWAYDLTTAASYANTGKLGVGAYTGTDGLYPMLDTITNGNLGESNVHYQQVSYVDYTEGIYIGYKWYETADAEGFWDKVSNEYGTGYNGVVQYPFGYGLSYTGFDWEVVQAPAEGSALDPNGSVTVTVKVTNTGTVAGRDVVELYYTAPYYQDQIEKAYKELAAFAKTDMLQPGESQELELTFQVEDMASYDAYDANRNGFTGYELDAGDYVLSVSRDAHTVEYVVTCTLSAGAQFADDPVTGLPVTNKFTGADAMDGVSLDGSDSGQNIIYLTRADFAGTFPQIQTGKTRTMADSVAALNLYTAEMADAWIDSSDTPITTGAANGLKVEENGMLTDLGYQLGSDFDDPRWDALLDQLTIDEMYELVVHGYSHNAALDSIGKTYATEVDGPAQFGGFTGMNAGTGFPSSSTLAQSWNSALAQEEGRTIGAQGAQRGYSGWYAPAMNMHRSPFNGRNYEYYSEDALLSGILCGSTVKGAKESGIYCYIKHFICNDGESYIYRDSVYTWMSEQALREVYLEPFRIVIENYGATGLMSSYNRIGAVWAGGSTALLTGILRNEWGFQGAVITDYSDHHDYMNGDQMLRAGGDLWMDGFGGSLKYETQSNSYQQALRGASKHIIYMYLNARAENIDYAKASGNADTQRPLVTSGTPLWKTLVMCVNIVVGVLFALALWRMIWAVRRKIAINREKKAA